MEETCRLCGSVLLHLFQKEQLGKYRVQYFQCTECECVQTEKPYWIEETYANFDFALDTGMVSRTQCSSQIILYLALHLHFSAEDICVDYGGGTGLLTRMLRDHGLNASWWDKYAKNIFALGFEWRPTTCAPKLLTAFEVFEHFDRPQEEIDALFALSPEMLLISTNLYRGQDKSWWYFLHDGQHVQFFSQKGMEWIAKQYGYHFQTVGETYHLFSKTQLPKDLLKKAYKRRIGVEKKALKRWSPRQGADHEMIKHQSVAH